MDLDAMRDAAMMPGRAEEYGEWWKAHALQLEKRVATLERQRDEYRDGMDFLDKENEAIHQQLATLKGVLDSAVDVFRHHDCPQSHLAPECHLCEILIEADALLGDQNEHGGGALSELPTRTADPMLSALFPNVAVELDEARPPVAHLPDMIEIGACPGPTSWHSTQDADHARWFAVPCRECFPDAPPPGRSMWCCGNSTDCPRGGWFSDPGLAWQLPRGADSDARLETGTTWQECERLYEQGLISEEDLRVARQRFIEARRE